MKNNEHNLLDALKEALEDKRVQKEEVPSILKGLATSLESVAALLPFGVRMGVISAAFIIRQAAAAMENNADA